jgi:FSR family fosmidomycin resistance protein-like MFS transporter
MARTETDEEGAAALAEAATAAEQPQSGAGLGPPEQPADTRGVATIAAAHLSHDIYSSFRDPLIPVVQEKLGISLAVASLMVPAQSLPSLLQPFFGVVADRTSRRWFVILAPAVAAVSVSSIGLAPNVAIVLLLLFTAGLASAAFHTPAVALVGEYGGSQMGRAMALFQAGGSLARSLGPLIVTGAIAIFTVEGLWVVMVFGILASITLYFKVDTSVVDAARKGQEHTPIMPVLRARGHFIAALLGFGLLRSLGRSPFSIFLVALLIDKGRSEWYAGTSLSAMFTAGILGGFVGGILSDRFGRRVIMAGSIVLLVPVYYLYLWLENGSVWVIGLVMLAGLISMASGPVELALAQEITPEARGPMAGLVLAFQFVTMSLIALGFGILADRIGLVNAYWIVPGLSLLAVAVVPFLPRRGQPLPPVVSELDRTAL